MELPLGCAGGAGVRAFISSGAAGDMSLKTPEGNGRRAGWLRFMGFDPERELSTDMVHSRAVVAADGIADARNREADGIVTDDPSLFAVVTVADCMPILVRDRKRGAFGALHSGWKGTGILAEALSVMAGRYGSRPADLTVNLGPRIGSCCYRVDEGRARAFEREFGSASVRYRSSGKGGDGASPGEGWYLDLLGANTALAERLGVGELLVAGDCTVCDKLFGSFRREGPERFTRMAVVIGVPKDGAVEGKQP